MVYKIRRLRVIAFLLFITPVTSLLGSLLINNYLTTFEFRHGYNYKFIDEKPGSKINILCSEKNNFCSEIGDDVEGGVIFEKNKNLGDCNLYEARFNYITENGSKLGLKKDYDFKLNKEQIFLEIKLSENLNQFCIKNSKNRFLYSLFPFFFEKIYDLKNHKKTTLGVGAPINPFIYGETSISNIVKRFPINFVFKTLIYLSVILMIIYWSLYNNILKQVENTNKNYFFFIFGMLSAIFLFLHVLFLGWTFESEFFTKLRRTYVVFFIFFEVLAQTFLIKKIFSIKDNIKTYLNFVIVYLKIFFVTFVCIITITVLIILMIYNLESKFDYILEWNYFLILLLFYYLSFLMWKKKIIL